MTPLRKHRHFYIVFACIISVLFLHPRALRGEEAYEVAAEDVNVTTTTSSSARVEGAFITTFNFNCENGRCPLGPYRSRCPWASAGAPVGTSGGYLIAYCFNDRAELQPPSIINDLASCTSGKNNIIVATSSGKLECIKKNGFSQETAPPVGKGSQVYFRFQCRTQATGFSPSSLVNNCPLGSYRYQCPLCAMKNGGSTLSCVCFNKQKQLQSISFLDSIKRCSIIYTSPKGKPLCKRKHGHTTTYEN